MHGWASPSTEAISPTLFLFAQKLFLQSRCTCEPQTASFLLFCAPCLTKTSCTRAQVCRERHEPTQECIYLYQQTLGLEKLTTQAHFLWAYLSSVWSRFFFKAVGSRLLTSHLIILLDRHDILPFSFPISSSVSLTPVLIIISLLCFYLKHIFFGLSIWLHFFFPRFFMFFSHVAVIF